MSLQEISRSIKNFFESKSPTIYCLSGEWGVGKTYLFNGICNDFLKKNPSNFNNIKLPKDNLIKISLFGIRSVDDLRHKIIAEKLENSQAINLVSNTFKYTLNHAKLKVPFVDFDQKKILESLESLFFNKFSNDLLICFDDIERKSPALRMIDFLGFVSMLKEKYNCKIFLILNDHILDEDNKNDYKKYFEKVVDHHFIHYFPNPKNLEENIENLYQSLTLPPHDPKEPIETVKKIRNNSFLEKNAEILLPIQNSLESLITRLEKFETESSHKLKKILEKIKIEPKATNSKKTDEQQKVINEKVKKLMLLKSEEFKRRLSFYERRKSLLDQEKGRDELAADLLYRRCLMRTNGKTLGRVFV